MIDGKFTMTAIAGEQKVEIQGVRAKPVESPKGDAVDEEENDVPDRCRRKTELTAEVMENVKVNQFTFELTSRP